MDKWAWVIGGGKFQVPLIEEFKSRGLKVLVSDRDLDCDGFKIANHQFWCDTYDMAEHASEAIHYLQAGMNLVAVQTAGTDVGPTVSIIASIFGLPGCSPLAAIKAKNKCMMREALGMDYPRYLVVQPEWKEGQVRGNWDYHCAIYPCVVKASDNWASRGMSIVHRGEDLYLAVCKARAANKIASNVLIEEYIEGSIEIATDWMVIGGKAHYLNSAKRYFNIAGTGLETGYITPSGCETIDMLHLVDDAVSCFGITEGPFKCDLMFVPKLNRWVIIECATRLSGSFDHNKAAVIAGRPDITKRLVDYSMGDSVEIYAEYFPRVCAVYTPVLTEGLIISEDMLQCIKSSPGVVEVVKMKDKVPAITDCASRALWIFCKGKTEEEAWGYAEHSLDSWKAEERSR